MSYKKTVTIDDTHFYVLKEYGYYNLIENMNEPLTEESAEELKESLIEKDKQVLNEYYHNNYSVKKESDILKPSFYENLKVDFYKGDLDYPISEDDSFQTNDIDTIKKVCSALRPFVGKKTNVFIDMFSYNDGFVSDLIRFCKKENITISKIQDEYFEKDFSFLEIEVMVKYNGDLRVIVNKGKHEHVKMLSIL